MILYDITLYDIFNLFSLAVMMQKKTKELKTFGRDGVMEKKKDPESETGPVPSAYNPLCKLEPSLGTNDHCKTLLFIGCGLAADHY